MADFQKIEVTKEETEPFSEQDIKNLEQQPSASETVEEQPQQEERPEWLPEKFQSPEELAKAYEELQSTFTKEKQGESEKGTEEPEGSEERDFAPYTEEFAEHGDLSEESRKEIEGWGIPRDMIDGYVEGQKAILDANIAAIHSEVGGEDAYQQMVEWAVQALPEGDQNAFNKAVMEGTPDETMFAVRSLSSRWKAAEGTSRPLIQGSTSHSGSSGGFRSLAEMTSAMKDPRYQKDPAYRKDIETRLASSKIL